MRIGSVQQAFPCEIPRGPGFEREPNNPSMPSSIMVVRAASIEGSRLAPVEGMDQVGIFVVAGASNRLQLVLDVIIAVPSIGDTTLSSVTLHFYSDYGVPH